MSIARSEAGVTLIESLIVLAILTAVIAISAQQLAPKSSSMTHRKLVHEIWSALKVARSDAILENREEVVSFDPQKRVFVLKRGARKVAVDDGIDVAIQLARVSDRKGASGYIAFYADGSSTGGTITLTSQKQSSSITVGWLTGRLELNDN